MRIPSVSLQRRFVAWLDPAPDSNIGEAIARGKSPLSEYVHLLWSVWVFITPSFGGGYDARWWLLTALSYPLFVWLYSRALTRPRDRVDRYAVGMVALCAAVLPAYPSGLSYFVFGCVMTHTCRRSTRGYFARVLLYNAVIVAEAWWIGYPWQAFVWMPGVTLIIGLIMHVERAKEERDAALRLSQDEVRRLAATAERERIGRDLHDLLGHTLSLIALKLELARKLEPRDRPAARRELDDAERVAREALAQVRSAVTGIRAADLAAELASAKLLLESSHVHLDYSPPPEALAPDLERGLALILREATTNIARHARARRVRTGFQRDGDTLQLAIEDDGRGGIVAEGNGITGMRDRVRALEGTLSIESPRGRGTRLLVRVPMRAASTAMPMAAAAPSQAPAAVDATVVPVAP